MRYDDASQTGSSAADNAPVARPDVDAIAPGSFSPATGNAITGAGTTSGLAGADAPANGSRIVEVHGAGGPTAGSGSAFQANGQYGVLNMDAQGNFTYVRNPGTPDGVQDVFGYTLADAKGATSSTTLTMDIGGIASAAATAATQGIVNLPAGVEMSDIKVNGRDLVIQMPDGTQMVIPGGAVFVPQLVIGDVQVPSSNLAALLIDSEPKPAAGSLQSSGGNFDVPVPPLDPGVPLGDLIPPTELAFTPPEVREVNQFIDEDVDAGTSFAQLDDDAQAGGIAGGVGDDPGGSTAAGFLPGSNGDGDLQWALLSSGAPAGFTYQDGPDGSVLVFQDGNANAVLRIDIDPDTGAYTVTQLGPIAHPAGGDENNVELVINYTVTDEDGDDDTGSLTINIDDDTPVARNDTDAIVGKETSTDGNVITGVDTTSGSAGADSAGADGLGAPGNPNDGVNGIHAGTSGAFVAPGTPVVGLFGTLVMDADGHYVYTRAEGVRTGGTDVFTYRIIDGDGDVTTATLTITVPADPVPQPNPATAIVDDDGLPAGNHDSQPGDDIVPDNDGDNNESTFRGTLTANFGTDTPGSFNFAAMNGVSGTVGVESVLYTWDAGTRILTATITDSPIDAREGTALYQVHLDAGGQFDVTLLQNVLQDIGAIPNFENNVEAVLTFNAVDSNGDVATSTLTISFDDDIPVAIEPPTDEGGHPIPIVSGLVDEDDLPSGNHDSQPGDDDPVDAAADGDPTTTGGLAGSLAALFSAGADAPLTFGLNPDTTSLALQGLTSNGHALVYDVDVSTGVLTATADLNGNGVFDAGETIFTLTVNEDGSWVFNLEGQLDHSVPGFEDNINIDLGAVIVATDADGDSAIGAAGGLVVTVDDDLPTPIIPENPNEGQTPIPIITGLVDEDDLPTGNHDSQTGDDDPLNLDGDNDGTTTGVNAPSLTGLFNGGADEPLSIVLSTDTSDLDAQNLTSKGGTIVYNVDPGTGVLTGYVEAGGGAGYQDGVDRAVFTLTVDTDGSWKFDLIDQLDHQVANTEDNLLIDFSSVITAVDSDGDPATAAPGAFVINVDDDMPTATEVSLGGTVDEDGVVEGVADAGIGDGIAGGPGDVAGENTVVSGNVSTLFSVGADEPLSYSLSNSSGGLPALNSNGVPVVYSVGLAAGVYTLTATAGAGGETVFTFTLDASTGDYQFTLVDQIDHPTLNGLAGDNTENDLAIALGSIIQATDFDGDTVTANSNGLVITVDDDMPVAHNDADTIASGLTQATGNVITGAGTTAGLGGSGADQTGADALVAITAIAGSGGTDTSFSGGFLSIGGDHGTLQIDASGNYTYNRTDNVTGTVQDVFTYTLTDADGDSVTATLTITMTDSAPVATTAVATVDDDGLSGGNPGGTGDDNANLNESPASASEATWNGTLGGSGGDAPTQFLFQTSLTGTTASAGTETVRYSVSGAGPAGFGTVLTATVTGGARDGTVLFTVTITDPSTGAYTVQLLDNVLHPTLNGGPGDNTENNVSVVINYQMRDADGDISASPGQLTINFDDDTPEATATLLTGTVDEDGVPGGIAGGTGDVAGEVTVATGNVSSLFSPGADAPLTYSLLTNTSGLPSLTSNNVAVTYSVVGNTLTASAGGNTIFTFAVNATTGAYTFTLVDQIDHPTLNGVAGDNTENDLTIALGSVISATDADGDSVTANANGLVITVDDDTPTATATQLTGTVDEDGVPSGIAGGAGDVPGEITVASGNVSGLFNSGADAPLTYSLLTNTSGLPVLTSEGTTITYSVVGNTLTASANGHAIFTFTVNATTGAYQFELLDQIDHPTLNGLTGDNTENDLTINLSSIIQASDADGDTVAAGANGLIITVDDDMPVINAFTNLDIVNDATPSGTGTFDFDIGADQNADHDDITVSNFTVLVNGQPVTETLTPGAETATTASYTFSFDYDTGTGGTATANGTLVFDKAAGTYTVELTNGPIQGFSILATGSADASDFVSYQVPTGGSGAPEVTVAALDTDFFVQFSGVAESGSGTGANNLFTTQGSANDFNPVTTNNFANLELFTQAMSTIQVSNAAAGVAGNTIQGGEVLDLNLYSTDPGGTLGGVPTASSTSMFIQLDGIGTSEDMIVVLKLLDTSTGEYTTKAVIVQNGDILTDADAASLVNTPYEGLGAALDNNDGLIVIEANDYQGGNSNLVIVGAQIAGSDEGIVGTGIDLNGDVGSGGNSTGTQAFSADTSDAPFKITSIGFLTSTTSDQNAQIDFDVTVEDADGDALTQHITVNIGDTSSTLSTLSTLSSTRNAVNDNTDTSTLFSSTQEEHKVVGNGTNTVLMGALAAAGLASEPVAANSVGTDGATDPQVASVAVEDSSSVAGESGLSSDSQSSSDALVGSGPAAHDDAQTRGGSSADTQVDHGNALDAPQQDNPAPAELLQGTDAPAQSEAAVNPFTAAGIQMPAAEQLVAKDGGAVAGDNAGAVAGDSAQHNAVVGQVLADALNGGDNPHIEAALNAVTGGGHAAQAANDALASHGGQGVSNGDMPDLAAFIAAHGVGMVAPMEMHHDAPAAV